MARHRPRGSYSQIHLSADASSNEAALDPKAQHQRMEQEINFDLDKDTPSSSEAASTAIDTIAKNYLAAVAIAAANGKPRPKLEIVGHTDTSGSQAHNQDLSDRRAQWTVTELLKRPGITKDDIAAKGVAADDLKEQKTGPDAANRRDTVDIVTAPEVAPPPPTPTPTPTPPPESTGDKLEAEGGQEVKAGVAEVRTGAGHVRHGFGGLIVRIVGLPFHLVAEVGRTVVGSGHGKDRKPGMVDNVGEIGVGTAEIADGSGKIIVGSGKYATGAVLNAVSPDEKPKDPKAADAGTAPPPSDLAGLKAGQAAAVPAPDSGGDTGSTKTPKADPAAGLAGAAPPAGGGAAPGAGDAAAKKGGAPKAAPLPTPLG